MRNEKVRMALAEYRVRMWELAEWLGIADSVLSKLFRKELPEDIQQKMVEVIECGVKGQPFDSGFIRQYMLSQDKRYYPRLRTAEAYSRYVARGLDEAERRRMEGGWDLSL